MRISYHELLVFNRIPVESTITITPLHRNLPISLLFNCLTYFCESFDMYLCKELRLGSLFACSNSIRYGFRISAAIPSYVRFMATMKRQSTTIVCALNSCGLPLLFGSHGSGNNLAYLTTVFTVNSFVSV